MAARAYWSGRIRLALVSIPVDGGHYFTDVLAGLIIAGLSLVAAKTIVARAHHARVRRDITDMVSSPAN